MDISYDRLFPSKGSELKRKHFGVVLTKKDTPNNAVITVVPLSSKDKPYYLDSGSFLITEVVPYLKRFYAQHHETMNTVTHALHERSDPLELNKEISKLSRNSE